VNLNEIYIEHSLKSYDEATQPDLAKNDGLDLVSRYLNQHITYLRLAGELTDGNAQNLIGNYYIKGVFFDLNHSKGFDWILESATNKNLQAMITMIDFLKNGLPEIKLVPNEMKRNEWIKEIKKYYALDFDQLNNNSA
jgi:TPR repeat protein